MRFLWFLVCAFSLFGQDKPGRLIIELDEQPALAVAKGERSAAKDGDRRARVLRQQEAVKRLLTDRNLAVRGSVDTVANAIIVEGGDIEEIRRLPNVRRVQEARYIRKMLDRAIPLLRIPEAWSLVGGLPKAGLGMKIGIIDTGIDQWHLGFQDPSLRVPDGFPKISSESDRPLTNNKVIVARTYDGTSAADMDGHGTGVAMTAAGMLHDGNKPNMSGVAPKAFLGNYRIEDGDGNISNDSILRAIDDAVRDGMDVINLSLGGPSISPTDEDIISVALQRAFEAGVVIATAAGNEGPDMQTVSDLGSVDAAISVGSTRNERVPVTPSIVLEDGTRLLGTSGANSENATTITGTMADVTSVDPTGLACSPLPPGSVAGKIALISRGTCPFEDKINNAEAGGAVAAVVYNNVASPLRVKMETGSATLKSIMISRADGLRIKDLIVSQAEQKYTITFSDSSADDPNVLSSFSSRGPTLEQRIKPDMLAIGSSLWTASNGTTPGDPSSSFYVNESGTSFSSPMVAGAAAVLKAGRPGLTAAQYKSLLVNSADPFPEGKDDRSLLQTGAGRLNLKAALTNNTVVDPVSVSFGEVLPQNTQSARELNLSNIGDAAAALELSVESLNPLKPSLSVSSLSLAPKASGKVTLRWTNSGPPPGEYQGFVVARDSNGGVVRVPYWLAIRSGAPNSVSLVYIGADTFRAGRSFQIIFRILDASNLPADESSPEISVVAGGGSAGSLGRLRNSGGAFITTLRLGPDPGVNTFKITVGSVERQFSFRAN